MRPPHRRPHRLSVHPRIDPRATSLTILSVLAVSPEPSVKRRALCMLHAYASCLHPRTHPADASAAWRRSPHTAVEPRPHPGAPAGAAAGPAGRAVAPPYAAAAALSNAPGISRKPRFLAPAALAQLPAFAVPPIDPTRFRAAWRRRHAVHEDRRSCRPVAAGLRRHGGPPAPPNDPAAWGYAARSPAAGEIWRTTPPSRTDTSAARARFSGQIAPPNSPRVH